MKMKLYRDLIHGFTALASSRTMAWMLIRNKCHEEGLPVPTMDKVVLNSEADDDAVRRNEDAQSDAAG